MACDVAWRTQAGRRTAANRDCAGVGIRGDEALCIVLDGSTRGRESGALARDIAAGLIDWFVDLNPPVTAQMIEDRLRELHRTLSPRWRLASASYGLIHLDRRGSGVALHAGDCLLGRMGEGGAAWLTRPHTLANAVVEMEVAAIATDPARHRLTRSFRIREFMPPAVLRLDRERDLILATDGFWADLPGACQARFLAGEDPPQGGEADDRSVLRVRIHDGAPSLRPSVSGGGDGLYVRVAGTPGPR